MQLRKIRDVPKVLHRLRNSMNSARLKDFATLLDRCPSHLSDRDCVDVCALCYLQLYDTTASVRLVRALLDQSGHSGFLYSMKKVA